MTQYLAGAVGNEGEAALTKGVLVQGDDGTNRKNLQTNAAGDLKATLDGETVGTVEASAAGILAVLAGALEVVQGTAADLNVTEASAAAILAALVGELEVVQGTAADLNVTEASAAAILAALGGELEVVQAVAADLNVTEASAAAILAALGGELEVVQAVAADLNVTEASAAAILAALGGELEVVQAVAADLNVTEASAAAILAALAGELEVVQGTAADLNVTEASAAAIKAAVELLDDVVAAHDASDSGTKSIKTGHRAVNIGATPAQVAAEDRTDSIANRDGVPWVSPGHPNIERLTRKDTAAQTNTVLKAVAAGQRWVTTGVSVLLDKECSEDAIDALVETGTTRILEHPGIAPGSGVVETCGGAPIAIGADGDDLLWTCEVPTDGSITVQVSGYLLDAA